jgi:hypothetical protein
MERENRHFNGKSNKQDPKEPYLGTFGDYKLVENRKIGSVQTGCKLVKENNAKQKKKAPGQSVNKEFQRD